MSNSLACEMDMHLSASDLHMSVCLSVCLSPAVNLDQKEEKSEKISKENPTFFRFPISRFPFPFFFSFFFSFSTLLAHPSAKLAPHSSSCTYRDHQGSLERSHNGQSWNMSTDRQCLRTDVFELNRGNITSFLESFRFPKSIQAVLFFRQKFIRCA